MGCWGGLSAGVVGGCGGGCCGCLLGGAGFGARFEGVGGFGGCWPEEGEDGGGDECVKGGLDGVGDEGAEWLGEPEVVEDAACAVGEDGDGCGELEDIEWLVAWLECDGGGVGGEGGDGEEVDEGGEEEAWHVGLAGPDADEGVGAGFVAFAEGVGGHVGFVVAVGEEELAGDEVLFLEFVGECGFVGDGLEVFGVEGDDGPEERAEDEEGDGDEEDGEPECEEFCHAVFSGAGCGFVCVCGG